MSKKYKCPFPECTYETEEVTDALAAVLLSVHSSGVHVTPGTVNTINPNSNTKLERVRRPTISAAGSSEDWSYFLTRWGDYVAATNVTGKEKVIQLLECCDEQLRKDLTRNAGGSLTDKTADEVMAAIKKLAVREENAMVARVQLHNMRQDRDETIRSFGARLRGQAGVCKFLVTCPGCNIEVNYTENVLRDVLTRGLADSEIQLDLLGERNQDMSLEEVFQFIEAKEAGKRSAGRLSQSHSTDAAQSQYRRAKNDEVKQRKDGDANELCSYCNKRGHGKSAPTRIRRHDCPAYGTICDKCGRQNHFASVCRSRGKSNRPQQPPTPIGKSRETESAIFDSLCTTTSLSRPSKGVISLDHHLYCHLTDHWVRQPSKPQPFITLTATAHPEDYTALGYNPPKSQLATAQLSAMADTGCQSCLASIKVIRRLGLCESDLIPVTMKMHAVNNKGISILGAVILRFSGRSPSGKALESRQIVYVTSDSDKLFLSRETCMALGIITKNFPMLGETLNTCSSIEPDTACNATAPTPSDRDMQTSEGSDSPPCTCPRRTTPPPKPTTTPFPATENSRMKMQQWLLDYYRTSTFNTCEHQPLPLMESIPMRLMVDPQAKPVAHHNPIPVPLHWQEEVKAGLDQDVSLGVLEPVPVGEPVTWCHRMVVCAKKNGKPRRTVDFQALNLHATRETHHTQSPFHQARSIPSNTKKTVFDCWNGYHSVPLHEDDRHLTTFITPWGRYRYKTAPQGYIASGDGYSRRFDEIVSHVPNKTKCIDDTLLWADNLDQSFFQAVDWLNLCGHNGIILNPDKFVFGADTVEFAGFEITPSCVRPCKQYLDAIRNFPIPANITDVRSWFGLINQVSYAFAATERMLPFRQLLQPGTPFQWTDELHTLFEESKSVIISEIEEGVRIFDKSKPTCLATDWSKSRIGFWLFQKHCQCPSPEPFCCRTGWKITLVGSRFTHAAESRYAPVEGEALAVADALDKARFFVLGCSNLIIAVDHKPLLKVFGDRSLEDITNARLRNLKEKSLRYRFRMVHIPGVRHKAADAVSRHPTGTTKPDLLVLPDDIAAATATLAALPQLDNSGRSFLAGIRHTEPQPGTCSITIDDQLASSASSALNTIAVTWDRVKLATTSSRAMTQLIHLIETGFPKSRNELPPALREYHQFREHLYTVDGIILYKNRIVIPPSLRQHILTVLHSAHQGVTSMTARAESTVFWPGITPAIIALRETCNHCNRMAPSQPSSPPSPVVPPAYPFQCVCADFFHYKGVTYLVIVDRYSNWPLVERAREGSTGLIDCLRRTFATFGIPDELATDGGPEFTATATRQFLKDWGIHHRLSSVAFPHSNCRAEIGVKSVKRFITDNTTPSGSLDTDSFQRAVLQYRNTPDPNTQLSPAQCVFGRPIKDFIPILPGRYQPHPTWRDTLATREAALRNRHMKAAERWSEHTKRLPPLAVGNHVRIQNQTGPYPTKWDKTGVVVEVRQFDQYVIRIDGSGRMTTRNRKFLRKYLPIRTTPPHLTIDDDLRHLAMLPHRPPKPITPAQARMPPQPSPAQPLTGPTPAAVTPDHHSPSPKPNAPQIQLSNQTPSPSPEHPSTATPRTHASSPQADPLAPSSPPKPPERPKKPPLALRRLRDFNSKGLLEQ